jgi:ribokinase
MYPTFQRATTEDNPGIRGKEFRFPYRISESSQGHPGPDETLLGRDFLMIGGGKAANVPWLARHLGVDAKLIAHVGSDSLREIALRFLGEIGVYLSSVRTIEHQSTDVSIIIVQPNGRKGIILAPNANDIWSKGNVQLVQEVL